MGAETGRKVGMPLDQFVNEAFEGLQAGKDQVIVGSVADPKTFHEIVEKRRTMFESLSKLLGAAYKK
jgi:hypothetical protein